jgi:hypothetical protein
MSVYKILSICLVVFIGTCVLLLATRNSGIFFKKPAAEDSSLGRENIMKEEKNPNIGTRFPEVTAQSLANTDESIPDSAKGKVALITVAFLRESQPQLDSWLGPFAERFGKEGFTFYEVPMIAADYTFMRSVIDGGMRGGIPKEKHKNVVTMYGDVEKYMNALNLDSRFGYAFILDQEGIIRWQGQGFATAETLRELFETAEQLAHSTP